MVEILLPGHQRQSRRHERPARRCTENRPRAHPHNPASDPNRGGFCMPQLGVTRAAVGVEDDPVLGPARHIANRPPPSATSSGSPGNQVGVRVQPGRRAEQPARAQVAHRWRSGTTSRPRSGSQYGRQPLRFGATAVEPRLIRSENLAAPDLAGSGRCGVCSAGRTGVAGASSPQWSSPTSAILVPAGRRATTGSRQPARRRECLHHGSVQKCPARRRCGFLPEPSKPRR